MPRYDYYCEGCEKLSTLTHSWKKKHTECPDCDDPRFSKVLSKSKWVKKVVIKNQAGSVVQQSIKDAKEEIKMEQGRLRKRKK